MKKHQVYYSLAAAMLLNTFTPLLLPATHEVSAQKVFFIILLSMIAGAIMMDGAEES